ncbi:RNA polymerase sigma-70 factor (ECF subfamily) [Rhodopirellula rubra]|uniref:RNA polymerase sigma-70 factor (ECF subfamily) n=1 Tax=Aporhodopirellula rubra TaxID=980271 RepID=A0A7W5H7B9_9BACT|nr:sigma-70 family RNA polymerase sigma factor [Aporhodopirellula rubra]MBB3208193.1 RNA polymerase sigma-70 factor (ECF subfamily) [Aporhodopirellula rubra]
MARDTPPEKIELTTEWVLRLTEAQPRLLSFLLKRLGNPDHAHEVLQEVNLVICRDANKFDEGTDFMAWAFTIARYQTMAFRKRQSRDRLVFPADLAASLDRLDSEMFTNEVCRLRETALQECLVSLMPVQRKLVIQRYAESLSVKAIAGELDKSANAVSLMLHRVREKLLTCVESKLSTEPPR